MTRQEMIDLLIDNDLSADGWPSSTDKDEWFAMILRDGFMGYNSMTDNELQQELNERGIEHGNE